MFRTLFNNETIHLYFLLVSLFITFRLHFNRPHLIKYVLVVSLITIMLEISYLFIETVVTSLFFPLYPKILPDPIRKYRITSEIDYHYNYNDNLGYEEVREYRYFIEYKWLGLFWRKVPSYYVNGSGYTDIEKAIYMKLRLENEK